MGKRGIIYISYIVLVCCFLCSIAFADDITVLKYGSNSIVKQQDLEYITCIDEPHEILSSTMVCLDSFDYIPVAITSMNDTCSYSTINLNKYHCNEYSLEATYSISGQQKKITKLVTVDNDIIDGEFVLETQKWDGGWGTPSKTAYAIWVLSQFNETYSRQIDEALRWLKETRQNEPKCWYTAPSTTTCNVEETIKTLAYLSQANITDQYRIISDGIAYVESMQNYIEDSEWTLEFVSQDDNTYCNATYDASAIMSNVNILEEDTASIDVTVATDGLINFTCTDDVIVNLYDHRNIKVFSHDFDATTDEDFDELTDYEENETEDETYKLIRIKPSCWTSTVDKWDECSQSITAYSLALKIDATQKAEGISWLEENLKNHQVTGKQIDSGESQLDTAFYLLAVNPLNTDILDWLLYIQNNDGSFGSGTDESKIITTSIAIKALQKQKFAQKSEVIRDAKHYISTKYRPDGYKNILIDAPITQTLFGNIQPFLTLDKAAIVQINDAQVVKVTLNNPTQIDFHNITANIISESGEDIATAFVPPDLNASESLTLSITPSTTVAGTHTGYVLLSATQFNGTKRTEIRRIYFSITQDAVFDIQPKVAAYNVYNYALDFYFNVKELNTPVTCDVSIESPYLVAQSTITFTRAGNAPLPLSIIDLPAGQITSTGTLTCTYDNNVKQITFDIDVSVYDQAPFLIEPSSISLTKYQKTVQLKVTNNLNRQIPLEIKFLANDGMFEIKESKIMLMPQDSEKIILVPVFTKDENITSANTLIVEALDHTQEVEVIVSIIEGQSASNPIFFIIVIAGVLIVGAIVFQFRTYILSSVSPALGAFSNILPASIRQKLSMGGMIGSTLKSGNKRRDRNMSYMMDIISIMKSMDKNEDDIIAKLQQEGYHRPVIEKALSELTEVEKKVANIRHEDTVLGILKTLDGDSEVIVKVLKDKGFSESDIRDAISELSTDTQEKEKKMRKDAGVREDEKL